VLGQHETLASLTSLIFAGGAWFVLLTVSLTVGMTNSLLDTSDDLEGQVRERTSDLENQAAILKRAKREAEAANRAKSAFLANMSHELRTPLNSVVGFTNVLRKNKGENLTAKDLLYLDRVLHNGKHLLGLINDILDLSKVEAGHMETHLEVIDLDDLVRRVAGQFSAQLREKEVELLVEVPSPIAPFETDVGKVTQVMVNLVGNALKFTQKGQVRVVVSVEKKSRRAVRIDVVDTGIGIPAKKLGTIFEAFRQADNRTSRDYGGTGLGLSISRSLCQLLGYELKVHSRPHCERGGGASGSTFSILLLEESEEETNEPVPRRDTYQVRPLTDSALARTLTEVLVGRTVMVVADRAGIGDAIRDLGVGVVDAKDAAAGLDLVSRSPPDLLIFDLGGPVGERIGDLLERYGSELPMVALVDGAETYSLPTSVTRLARSFETSQLLTILWRLIVRRSRFDTTPLAENDPAHES
jgi:signal transduction histidine kinase